MDSILLLQRLYRMLEFSKFYVIETYGLLWVHHGQVIPAGPRFMVLGINPPIVFFLSQVEDQSYVLDQIEAFNVDLVQEGMGFHNLMIYMTGQEMYLMIRIFLLQCPKQWSHQYQVTNSAQSYYQEFLGIHLF